jgi:hypothetical protein
MTDLVEERINIQAEETDYRSGTSEAVFQRVGKSINFVNKRQHQVKEFMANGRYSAKVGFEGLLVFPINCEVLGCVLSVLEAGSSGTTAMDVHWYSAPGVDEGTIFTTKPSITSAAGDAAYVGVYDETSIGGGTGMTGPELAKTEFDAGDALRVDIDTAQDSSYTASLTIYFRPR